VAITIAIIITEVPYEECGSPRFLYSMKLITITGPSGAGKDTVAKMMSKMTDWPVICSYTTRPRRFGEVAGEDHYFVDKCDVPREKMLAYTQYGGYEYWTMVDQIKDIAIYVIDEAGLVDLKKHHPEITVYSIYVFSPAVTRLTRDVKLSRILRDEERLKLTADNDYDYCIYNDFCMNLKNLCFEVARCVCHMPFVKEHLDPYDPKKPHFTD
jgi:guanylate kinase